jgi:hypothetical protein
MNFIVILFFEVDLIKKKIPRPSPSLKCLGVSKELWDQDSWLSLFLFFKKRNLRTIIILEKFEWILRAFKVNTYIF